MYSISSPLVKGISEYKDVTAKDITPIRSTSSISPRYNTGHLTASIDLDRFIT